ncbi:MAG TPA: TetR family transcriptional regulator [Ornithinimicrobium sp.]|uniref:TetR/AcrR family transcriptional regulator n=1 Tax=Ornithinimicrobium sp. TaxID=1977084 RepID=UPI002B475E96|nr:TetR family transcriptional regulator [Ornithinimicrobium sp.]HKJ12882.1 TetR family transcriptional regulator [Ornithinimicrobium sp.]
MSSTVSPESEPPGRDDRTTAARIRDAALALFGERGFPRTTVRAIAERAGVSPGLVVHHFGSKDGLRDAVDDALVEHIRSDKFAAMTGAMSVDERTLRESARDHAPAMAYLARAMTEDAQVGRHLYDRLYRDALNNMRAGEEAGLIRSTDDAPARAAALLNASLGQNLLRHHLLRVLDIEDPIEGYLRIARPLLDVYTDGLFTDTRMRDAMRASREEGTTP